MTSYRFGHLHLYSPEPRKTSQFYEKILNAKVLRTRESPDGRLNIDLDLNGTRLLIAERKGEIGVTASGISLDHFGLEIDNIEDAVAELKAKGVKIRDEIKLVRPGVKVAWLLAPDNVAVELVERKE
jgi:lactoylglutathione lyase